MSKSGETSLYVFCTDDWEAFKVGISNDVDDRWAELQTGNHREIELVFEYRFNDRETARRIERILHERLKRYRLSGEWFSDWKENQTRFFKLFEKYTGVNFGWRRKGTRVYKMKKWIKSRPDFFWFLVVQIIFLILFISLTLSNWDTNKQKRQPETGTKPTVSYVDHQMLKN